MTLFFDELLNVNEIDCVLKAHFCVLFQLSSSFSACQEPHYVVNLLHCICCTGLLRAWAQIHCHDSFLLQMSRWLARQAKMLAKNRLPQHRLKMLEDLGKTHWVGSVWVKQPFERQKAKPFLLRNPEVEANLSRFRAHFHLAFVLTVAFAGVTLQPDPVMVKKYNELIGLNSAERRAVRERWAKDHRLRLAKETNDKARSRHAELEPFGPLDEMFAKKLADTLHSENL